MTAVGTCADPVGTCTDPQAASTSHTAMCFRSRTSRVYAVCTQVAVCTRPLLTFCWVVGVVPLYILRPALAAPLCWAMPNRYQVLSELEDSEMQGSSSKQVVEKTGQAPKVCMSASIGAKTALAC
jgi:hypothetical protein